MITAGPRRGTASRLFALGLVSMLLGGRVSAQSPPQLTGSRQLAAAYDAIFDARFDDVPALLARACGDAPPRARAAAPATTPAPAEACRLLEGVAVWWRIQMDPNDRSRDEEFRTRIDRVIDDISAWTEREPMRAEAWFYLGGAYGARAQWRVLRSERVAAARDGKRIKDALERARELDPALEDAYFGIGLYHYYADVAPTAAKFLRWLLMLPGGDREAGLHEMLQAREAGELIRSEADYQLHLIYLWYEKDPQRALELLRELRARHPRNPHFLQLIAQVEDVYLHDTAASQRSWQQLLDAAHSGRVAEPQLAETVAHIGLARQLDARQETDAAIAHLRTVIDRKPAAPVGAVARAQLLLGYALDRQGQHQEAVTAYRAAIESAPADDPDRIAAAARQALRSASRAR